MLLGRYGGYRCEFRRNLKEVNYELQVCGLGVWYTDIAINQRVRSSTACPVGTIAGCPSVLKVRAPAGARSIGHRHFINGCRIRHGGWRSSVRNGCTKPSLKNKILLIWLHFPLVSPSSNRTGRRSLRIPVSGRRHRMMYHYGWRWRSLAMLNRCLTAR